MADIHVSYQDLNDAASKLRASQQNIESELQGATSQIQTLVNGGFVTDSASGQFEQSFSEFTTGVKQVIQGLTSMGDYLQKAGETLAQVDSDLAKTLKG